MSDSLWVEINESSIMGTSAASVGVAVGSNFGQFMANKKAPAAAAIKM